MDMGELIEENGKEMIDFETYQLIINNIQEGILFIDDQETIVYLNDKLAYRLGFEREEMVGEYFLDFLDEHSKKLILSFMERSRIGMIEHLKIDFLGKNGAKVIKRLHSTPIFDKNNNYLGIIALVFDDK